LEHALGRVARVNPSPITIITWLVTSAARDLGYALAYLVIVVDLELAPIESTLLEQLRLAFSIPRARADDLTEAVARIVTPGEAPAPDLDVVAGER